MDRIPFGVSRLDAMIDGGAPAGSVVLLAEDGGAGAREFAYTSAVMNGLGHVGDDAFDLHYGDLADGASIPGEIHYVSLTDGEPQVRQEMGFTMETDLVDAAATSIEVADLSPEYFQLSPVPREWYEGRTRTISELAQTSDRRSVLDALSDYLDRHADGNLVLLDSVTDLVTATSDDRRWSDVVTFLRGLGKAAHGWEGLVLLLVNKETMPPERLAQLMDASDGTFFFEWERGGSERSRTMVVREFRGVLSQLEEENIVQFETEIGDAGFDISDVRKIR